jgi:hypothetical protein
MVNSKNRVQTKDICFGSMLNKYLSIKLKRLKKRSIFNYLINIIIIPKISI